MAGITYTPAALKAPKPTPIKPACKIGTSTLIDSAKFTKPGASSTQAWSHLPCMHMESSLSVG
eukprot:scaffold1809_cov386-Prasinococcus_capsulatus_cf.AAC.46